MVRLIRFMSEEELEAYLRGEDMVNETEFEQSGSKGFCFFNADEIDPLTAQHILTGIATMEYMVEFAVEERTLETMTKGKGRYHLPGRPVLEGTYLPEYSTTKYNRKDFFPWQIWRLYIQTPVFAVNDDGNKTVVSLANKEEEQGNGQKENRKAF